MIALMESNTNHLAVASRPSADDAAVITRDKALKGLPLLFTPALLAHAIERHCPRLTISSLKPTYIRYKPGMNCLIGYDMQVGSDMHWVHAKAFTSTDQHKRDKALQHEATTGPLGVSRFVIGEADIIVSFFPNDLKLRGLKRLNGAALQQRLIKRIFSDRPDLWDGDISMIRYKPERRLVAQLLIEGESKAVIKMHTGNSYTRLRDATRSFKSKEPLKVARRIDHTDRYRVIAFDWLPGDLLSESLYNGAVSPDDLLMVGKALTQIHAQHPDRLPRTSHEMEAAHLFAVARQVGQLCPSLDSVLKRTATHLSNHLLHTPRTYASIHGDFYAKQILLQDGKVGVLDFDESAFGNPLIDIGNFIAHMERDRERYGVPTHLIEQHTEAFLEGYCAQGTMPSRESVNLFAAEQLFKLLPHPFRFREPNWPQRIETLLNRIQALSAHAGRSTFYLPSQYPEDPAMPFLEDALTAAAIITPLQQALQQFDPEINLFSLETPHLCRHKPGRRALVAYSAHLQKKDGTLIEQTLLGKIRAKGLDQTTYRLMQTMWQGDFNERNGDGLYVPRPAGALPAFNMWLQEKIDGETTTQFLQKPTGIQIAEAAARALHKLNTRGPAPERQHTLQDELEILQDRLGKASQQFPDWSRRIDAVGDACVQLAAALPPTDPCPIHRDFYPDNLLVASEGLYLLDLDLYTLGNPALDAGNFIGHITEYSLRTLRDPDGLLPFETAFVDTYAALTGSHIRESIDIYKTLTLARHIQISSLFPDRRLFTEAILTCCEQRLQLHA